MFLRARRARRRLGDPGPRAAATTKSEAVPGKLLARAGVRAQGLRKTGGSGSRICGACCGEPRVSGVQCRFCSKAEHLGDHRGLIRAGVRGGTVFYASALALAPGKANARRGAGMGWRGARQDTIRGTRGPGRHPGAGPELLKRARGSKAKLAKPAFVRGAKWRAKNSGSPARIDARRSFLLSWGKQPVIKSNCSRDAEAASTFVELPTTTDAFCSVVFRTTEKQGVVPCGSWGRSCGRTAPLETLTLFGTQGQFGSYSRT